MIEASPQHWKELFTRLCRRRTTFSEVGVVVELRERRIAVVACVDDAACSGCAAAGGCCSATSGGRRLYADNIPCARVGDKVRVEVETSAPVVDSATVLYITAFVMLLLGLALGYAIASLLPVGLSAALLALLMGATFMVGTLAVFRLGRGAVVQQSLARIVEIIATDTSDIKA